MKANLLKRIGKHKLVVKNLIFTFLPVVLYEIIDRIFTNDKSAQITIAVIAAAIFLCLIILISRKEEKENEKLNEEVSVLSKYKISQKLLNSVTETEKYKRNLLKNEELPDYEKEILLYYPHHCVEQICSNIKSLLVDIMELPSDKLSVSFIYQYPTEKSKWKWITRKNSTINKELDSFVTDENSHSYFNYIVTDKMSMHFENEKTNLINEGHYWISESDKRYPTLGSIASYRMSFMKNEQILAIGYLVISTYGRLFVENRTDDDKIKNCNALLGDTIIPAYRHLIESELGFMYERHVLKKAKENQSVEEKRGIKGFMHH